MRIMIVMHSGGYSVYFQKNGEKPMVLVESWDNPADVLRFCAGLLHSHPDMLVEIFCEEEKNHHFELGERVAEKCLS